MWMHKLFFTIVFMLSFTIGILAFPTRRQDGTTKSILSEGVGYINGVIGNGTGNFIEKTDGYTTVLVMGIDSRKLDFNGSEFNGKDINIDVIMQVIYDHKNNNIFMVSIPRDTGYTIDEDCANQGFDKAINRLYRYGQEGNCINGGLGLMQKYTEKITGFKNNYYALISFDTFYDVIREIGEENEGEKGLWIDVPETIYELYPTDTGFESVTFKKGMQFMDSEKLLKYARSRKNSSDFARTRRQQIVIEAIKGRINDLDFLQSPTKLMSVYNSFRNNSLYSELGIKEMVAAVGLVGKIAEAPIYHIVLDNQFGGTDKLILKPAYSPPYKGHNRPGYYLTPKDYAGECCTEDEYIKIKSHLRGIITNPSNINVDFKE